MARPDVAYYVALARETRSRIPAIWAGIEANRRAIPGAPPVCPFRADEADLIGGFRRDLAIAADNARLDAWSPRPCGQSHAAYSHRED